MGQRADDRNTREGTNRDLRKSSRFDSLTEKLLPAEKIFP